MVYMQIWGWSMSWLQWWYVHCLSVVCEMCSVCSSEFRLACNANNERQREVSVVTKFLKWKWIMLTVNELVTTVFTAVCLTPHAVSSECPHSDKQSQFVETAGCINKAEIDQSCVYFTTDGFLNLCFWMCKLTLARNWTSECCIQWIMIDLLFFPGDQVWAESEKWSRLWRSI